MTITIYGTKSCTYCRQLKELLDENGIKYEYIDVTGDDAAIEKLLVKTGGRRGVPVIDIDGEITMGFDKKVLKEKLNIK